MSAKRLVVFVIDDHMQKSWFHVEYLGDAPVYSHGSQSIKTFVPFSLYRCDKSESNRKNCAYPAYRQFKPCPWL